MVFDTVVMFTIANVPARSKNEWTTDEFVLEISMRVHDRANKGS